MLGRLGPYCAWIGLKRTNASNIYPKYLRRVETYTYPCHALSTTNKTRTIPRKVAKPSLNGLFQSMCLQHDLGEVA